LRFVCDVLAFVWTFDILIPQLNPSFGRVPELL
jgi:hypothetical protein